ncbi:gliding motility-associated C-terminal domain-containing protein [Chitinophaga defluvii]|uniref:Gliding motility-associated C-terminal domain-containing protein n=1 Tax=Chitinophaga defluvii TaxID=3163343 RepID=A0ABV2TCY8_9BACT
MRSLLQSRVSSLYLFLAVFTAYMMITASSAAGMPETARRLTNFSYSTTCLNDSTVFIIADTTAIDSAKWQFGDPVSGVKNTANSKRPYHFYQATGSYTVTLSAFRNGVEEITTQTITIVTPERFYIGPKDQTLCEGNTLLLQAPVIPGATYLWQDSSTASSFLVAEEGTYKVMINGCLSPDSTNIFYTPIPTIDLGDDHTLCTGEKVMLDASAQNCSYQWNTGATTPTIDVTTAGYYEVTVSPLGCADIIASVTFNFTGPEYTPPFSLGPDTLLCPGESVIINAPVTGATRYRWSNGSNASFISVSRPATIWAYVLVNDLCEVVDTMEVNYNALRNIDLGGDTTVCKGENLVLTADYGTGTYLWQDGSEQATFYVKKPGYYYVQAKIGRCESSDTIHVNYDDTLRINLGPDLLPCRGETVVLHPAGAGADYKWQDSSRVPVYQVTTSGIYAVVAHNTCGWADDQVTVTFEDCECQLFMPTAFSPNGDGKNDYFKPLYRCILGEYQLSIYNRWGERLFFTTDPQIGWTGKRQGTPVDAATYIWVMDYKIAKTGEAVHKTGMVTVVY